MSKKRKIQGGHPLFIKRAARGGPVTKGRAGEEKCFSINRRAHWFWRSRSVSAFLGHGENIPSFWGKRGRVVKVVHTAQRGFWDLVGGLGPSHLRGNKKASTPLKSVSLSHRGKTEPERRTTKK